MCLPSSRRLCRCVAVHHHHFDRTREGATDGTVDPVDSSGLSDPIARHLDNLFASRFKELTTALASVQPSVPPANALPPIEAAVEDAAKWNSGGQPETTLGRPVSALLSDGTYSWGPLACAYCAFREPAPAGTATGDQWWFGTGDGAHNPYRCQPAKRYLAEGGDAAVDPAYAPHLRRCLRVAPNRG